MTQQSKRLRRGLAGGIGLLSASILGLEIALTNVFGVLLQYHYVALIVSFAVCGIGVGAYLARGGPNEAIDAAMRKSAWLSLGLGGYIAAVSFGLAKFPYVDLLLVYALISAVPFVLFGWLLGTAFRNAAGSVGTLYASDLLGAAVGAFAVYMLLQRFGGLQAIYALCLLPVAAALLLFASARAAGGEGETPASATTAGGERAAAAAATAVGGERAASASAAVAGPRTAGLVLSLVLLAAAPLGMMAGQAGGAWNIDFTALHGAPPDKTLVGTLQNDPKARVIRTEWDAFARTDIVETSDPSRRVVFVDGGAGSYMYRFDGDLKSVSGLAHDIEFLPFAAGSAAKAAVIGAGGGRDILYALLAGAKDITAVELSPGLVGSVRAMADYNGGLLDRPEVHTVIGDGRNVLERSGESYDLIVLDLVYSQVGGLRSQTLAENYIFTQEAFDTYVKRLNPDGRIIVIAHQGLEGTRAYYTGLSALMRADGATPKEAAAHTALLMAPEGSRAPNLTLAVIQKSPLTDAQLSLLDNGSRALGLTPLFVPKSRETLLKPLLDGKMPFGRFVRDADYNVYPTTDNRPFFFQIDRAFPPSLQQWFAAVALLTLAFAALVWRRSESTARRAPGHASAGRSARATGHAGANRSAREPGKTAAVGSTGRGPAAAESGGRFTYWPLAYFALIGVGYMALQLPLIQMAMLYFGSPVRAAAVIIVAMLLGGSIGSRLAQRRSLTTPKAVAGIVAIVVVLAAVQAVFGEALMQLELLWRTAIIGTAVLALGVCLGVPLPAGLLAEERRKPGGSGFWFAANGIAGLWGSWIAVFVAMAWGFQYALALGVICYAGVAAIYHKQMGWRET